MPTSECNGVAAAAVTLARLTDICAVFAACDDRLFQRCSGTTLAPSPRTSARLQMAYGAFRHSFIQFGVPGSDGSMLDDWTSGGGKKRKNEPVAPPPKPPELPLAEVLPWASLSQPLGCGRRIDLVIRRRSQRPLLGELGELLTHAPAGSCVFVTVYETRARSSRFFSRAARRRAGGIASSAASSSTALPLPSADARDALLGVQRLVLPATGASSSTSNAASAASTPTGGDDLDALLSAHRAQRAHRPSRSGGSSSGGSSSGGSSNGGSSGGSSNAGSSGGGSGSSSGASVATPPQRADTIVIISDAAGLGNFASTRKGANHIDPFCRARALLSHEYGPPVIRLPGGAVALRVATEQVLTGGSLASWIEQSEKWAAAARGPDLVPPKSAGQRKSPLLEGAPADALALPQAILPEYKCSVLRQPERNRQGQVRQRMMRALAMLLVHAADLMQDESATGRHLPQPASEDGGGEIGLSVLRGGGRGVHRLGNLSSSGGWRGALAGSVRPPWRAVPLACLESDFMDANRELTLGSAAAAYVACEQSAIATSARLAGKLHAEIDLVQRGEHPDQLNAHRDAAESSRGSDTRGSERRPCRIGANRRRAAESLVAVGPHPSGFFSLLHGLLKPLMWTLRTRRVLLTPRVLEFTHEKFAKSPCAARDLSCYFVSLSPPCDALEREVGTRRAARLAANSNNTATPSSTGRANKRGKGSAPYKAIGGREWPALPKTLHKVREAKFVYGEARASHHIPPPYESRGWFWYSSHLLSYLLRPNDALLHSLGESLDSSGLRTVHAAGRVVIGMHVRHGDACRSEEIVRARRTCTPLSAYMAAADRLLAVRAGGRGGVGGKAGAGKAGAAKPAIYLATDSKQVVKESAGYSERYEIIHLSDDFMMRHNPKQGEAILWDKRIWQRFFWGQTDWTQAMAWAATIEMLLLAHSDIFIGKFTSNMFRAAYALRAAQCDCAPLFASLDAPMCFDYGVSGGRNWEFPIANRSSGGLRDRTDATFQC